MKKSLISIFSVFILMLIITGCTTSKSYTYKVETGDTIKIKLDTSDKYDITKELPFTIKKDDKTLSQGAFLTNDGYDQCISAVNTDSKAKVIESKTANGIEYTFYSYNDSEYNYIIKIVDSNTGILLGNNVSESSARECFNRLKITKE